ncbi:MAG: OmpA family protein [Desulfopila sp.]|jgi:outer membrane protein OmpA-like peptidoglycan-associated protein|nr:OmpA family protein [Desulfopila sp.]
MNTTHLSPAFRLALSAIILLSFLAGGCSFFPSETRYTTNTKHYTVPKDDGAEVYTSPAGKGKHSTVGPNQSLTEHYTVGPHDSLTEHYILKEGPYKITQRPPSASSSSGTTDQTASSDGKSSGMREKTLIILEASHILFDFDKYTIKKEYHTELNRWVDYFLANQGVTAEIHGHTDSIGTEAYNQKLSERRAQAVINYLIKKGVEPSRLASKGFGESSPVAPNTTPAERQKNRRVEVEL